MKFCFRYALYLSILRTTYLMEILVKETLLKLLPELDDVYFERKKVTEMLNMIVVIDKAK